MPTPASLAFMLDRGINLEDTGTLLAWNSTRDRLQQTATPQVEEQPGRRVRLWWRDRHWLGGLPVTLGATLRKAEPFRRVEAFASLDGGPAEAFSQLSRHLDRHLGQATHRRDDAVRTSRFWRRGDVEISLVLAGQARRPVFGVSYHGPEPAPTGGPSEEACSFEAHLSRLGLTFRQWHDLKNYLLDLQDGVATQPPGELLEHPIVIMAERSRQAAERSLLDQAAATLVGCARGAWLALWRS